LSNKEALNDSFSSSCLHPADNDFLNLPWLNWSPLH